MTLETNDASNLRHMLGADSSSPGFRNYYAATVDGKDSESMRRLEDAGLVEKGGTINEGKLQYWHATKAGIKFVGVKELM